MSASAAAAELPFTAAAAAALRQESAYRLRFLVGEAAALARRRVGGAGAGGGGGGGGGGVRITADDLSLAYNIWCRAGPTPYAVRGCAATAVTLREEAAAPPAAAPAALALTAGARAGDRATLPRESLAVLLSLRRCVQAGDAGGARRVLASLAAGFSQAGGGAGASLAARGGLVALLPSVLSLLRHEQERCLVAGAHAPHAALLRILAALAADTALPVEALADGLLASAVSALVHRSPAAAPAAAPPPTRARARARSEAVVDTAGGGGGGGGGGAAAAGSAWWLQRDDAAADGGARSEAWRTVGLQVRVRQQAAALLVAVLARLAPTVPRLRHEVAAALVQALLSPPADPAACMRADEPEAGGAPLLMPAPGAGVFGTLLGLAACRGDSTRALFLPLAARLAARYAAAADAAAAARASAAAAAVAAARAGAGVAAAGEAAAATADDWWPLLCLRALYAAAAVAATPDAALEVRGGGPASQGPPLAPPQSPPPPPPPPLPLAAAGTKRRRADDAEEPAAAAASGDAAAAAAAAAAVGGRGGRQRGRKQRAESTESATAAAEPASAAGTRLLRAADLASAATVRRLFREADFVRARGAVPAPASRTAALRARAQPLLHAGLADAGEAAAFFSCELVLL